MPALSALRLGRVPYRAAWSLQRRIAQARRHGEIDTDCLLLLEHPHVFTMGRSGSPDHVPGGPGRLVELGADYVAVDRGGSVTYHGPGQLVAYPIVRIAGVVPFGEPASASGDAVRFVRALEAALIDTAAAAGVEAVRREGLSGAWVDSRPPAKLAAVGVKVSGGVSTHGIALNVTTDLDWFRHIVPCGIRGCQVTSLAGAGARDATVDGVAPIFAAALAARLGLEVAGAGADLVALARDQIGPADIPSPALQPA